MFAANVQKLLDFQHVSGARVRTRIHKCHGDGEEGLCQHLQRRAYGIYALLLAHKQQSKTKSHHLGERILQFQGAAVHQTVQDRSADLGVARAHSDQTEGDRGETANFQAASLVFQNGKEKLDDIGTVCAGVRQTQPEKWSSKKSTFKFFYSLNQSIHRSQQHKTQSIERYSNNKFTGRFSK